MCFCSRYLVYLISYFSIICYLQDTLKAAQVDAKILDAAKHDAIREAKILDPAPNVEAPGPSRTTFDVQFSGFCLLFCKLE